MTDKKTTSLSNLYAQRKARTQMSVEQRATLHQAMKQQRRRNWFVIVPSFAASMMVILLLWPTLQTNQNSQGAPEFSTTSMDAVEIAENEPSYESDNLVSQELAVIAEEEVPVTASKAIAPAVDSLEAQSYDAISEPIAETVEEEALPPMTVMEPAVQLWTNAAPALVRITDANERQATDCAGRPFEIPDDIELPNGVWVLLTQNESELSLELVEATSPCDEVQ